MAKRKSKKNSGSYEIKVTKKNWKLFLVLLIILVIAGAAYGAYYYISEKKRMAALSSSSSEVTSSEVISSSETGSSSNNSTVSSSISSSSSSQTSDTSLSSQALVYHNLSFNFLELGVYNAGDCTYIKAGDVDILIDAGAKYASVETLEKYIDTYCTDKKLEYVIATHAHEDHIAGMSGGTAKDGILYKYAVGTIIDFATSGTTSNVYQYYTAARDYAVSKGAVHYTAKQCFDETDGAKKEYVLDEESNITMDIIYNAYYYSYPGDENNCSVCTLFNYGAHHFLLTGDLEKEGEGAMATYYDGTSPEKTLPHCDLFKAGHHGSPTSSNESLLSKITPDICCVCCCAGGSEYTPTEDNTFPSQAFINRIAKYTSAVYVTSQIDEEASRTAGEFVFKSMNGNINVKCDGLTTSVSASNNLTKLKDSAWFNETVYLDSNGNICSGAKKKDFFTSASSGVTARVRRTWPADGKQ
ncbi:MAG: MBL fold metallo-hydrolase [Bacilli bacterium]|jgi:competence protein ComEC|nr:MBL fold metallo-hydrolase [Bacilli bacterium]